jgi:hypothetical protein
MAKKRKKRTPEEIAAEREFQRQSDENYRRLRELIDRGWEELRRKRAEQAARGETG